MWASLAAERHQLVLGRAADEHVAGRDRSHRDVRDHGRAVARGNRDREGVRPCERRAAFRMGEALRRGRREGRDEPALRKPSHPVPEGTGGEATPRDDDARALGRIRKRRAHDRLEHEVAQRAVAVPALETPLRLDEQRPCARVELEAGEPLDADEAVARLASPLSVGEVRDQDLRGFHVEAERR